MSAETFEGWAILELMGHRRLAGLVSEVELAGGKFLRIDVPILGDAVATQLYSPGAVYCLTPTSEATARMVAKASTVAPVSRWELPGLADVEDLDDADVVDEGLADVDEDLAAVHGDDPFGS